MWRSATVFFLLIVSTNRIYGKFYTEGGSYQLLGDELQQQDQAASQYDDLDGDQLLPYPSDDDKLATIISALKTAPNQEMLNDDSNFEPYPMNAEKIEQGVDGDLARAMGKENPEQIPELKQPLTTQKKGQFEYETYIEPVASNQLKNVEYMNKRVPVAEHSNDGLFMHALHSTNNVVFIGLLTVCCVAIVMGIAGGAYYYNLRKSTDKTFDDFTRYSPAGPGRDKKQKKVRNGCNANITENGDESLAYKAQLHHYQQTKQKIIGAEEGISGIPDVGAEEKSDDELEDHNFSVYECPGLAPTGDIEVSNPNFDIKHQNVSQ